MKENNKNHKLGFTLLELLVVVLIIGILAGIALPQYRKVLIKSKAAQMYEAVSTIARSAQAFYLSHDNWPTNFEELDIDYDISHANESVCATTISEGGIKRKDDFELLLGSNSSFNNVSIRFTSGPYKCTGFSIFFKNDTYPNLENKLLCFEIKNISLRGSKNQKGDFCEQIMNYTFYQEGSNSYNFIQ